MKQLQCPESAFDPASGECASPVWVDVPAWPELSASDAASIAMAVIGVWVIAWAWREIGRTLDRYDRPE